MIFERRFAVMVWLGMAAFGIFVVAASLGLTWIWIAGWILVPVMAVFSVISSRVRLGDLLVGMLKCSGVMALAIAGIVLVALLVEAGGAYRAFGWLVGGSALAVMGFYLIRFWWMVLGGSARTLYRHAATGKGRLHDAAFQIYRGEFAAAEKSIDDYQRTHPESAEGFAWRASMHFQMDRTAEAARDAATAITAKEGSDGLGMRGQILLRVGALDQAISDFDRCIALDPKLLGFRTWKAVALVRLGRADEAIEQLTSEDRGILKSTHTALARGDAFMLKGDTRKARKAYRETIKRGKCELRARLWPSQAYVALAAARCGDWALAESAAAGALERNLQPAVAYYALAILRASGGDAVHVEESLRQMIQTRPYLAVNALAEQSIEAALGESLTRVLGEQAEREAQVQRASVLEILRL